MKQQEWQRVSASFTAMFISLIVTAALIGFLGPKPGAPVDERTLSLGSLWIYRINERVEGNTHHWSTEVNWSVVIAIIVAAGVLGLAYPRTKQKDGEAT
jgi:heme/copper-type cytochrome/quinol oxidase subunit 2